jgi:succinate dehydrogenase/fumarate reductase flavoprotein subunit
VNNALEELHAELKNVMFASAGLVRDAWAMKAGIDAIHDLRRRLHALAPVPSGDLKRFFEVRNMLDVGEAVVRSALHRRESRGAHYRNDYPEKDDGRWLVATRVFRSGDEMRAIESPLQRSNSLAT